MAKCWRGIILVLVVSILFVSMAHGEIFDLEENMGLPGEEVNEDEALSITDVAIHEIGIDQVRITWKTNREADSRVDYGVTPEFGETQYQSDLTESHEVFLTGLNQGIFYFFRISSCEGQNTCATAEPYSFVTAAIPEASLTVTAPSAEETPAPPAARRRGTAVITSKPITLNFQVGREVVFVYKTSSTNKFAVARFKVASRGSEYLNIRHNDVQYELEQDREKLFDLDKDGTSDIQMKLVRFSSPTVAKVTLSSTRKVIELPAPEEDEQEVEVEVMPAITGYAINPIPPFSMPNFSLWIALVVAVLVAALVVIIILLYNSRKN